MAPIDKTESLEFQVQILTDKLRSAREDADRLRSIAHMHNEKLAKAVLKRHQVQKSMLGQIKKLEERVKFLEGVLCIPGSPP